METGEGRFGVPLRSMIPKQIHRIWLGGPEPDWTQPFAATWRQPGWELREWTDSNVESLFPLRNQSIWERAPKLCPDHVGQLRSDVLRYELLERFGGVYVDTDFECLRPIDDLIGDARCFAAWEAQDRWIANGFMGSVPTHPFIERLIQGLPANVKRHRKAKPNKISGPQYLTRQWHRDGRRVRIIDQHHVFPYGWREIREHAPGEDWGDAWLCHHWANKRRERNVPCPTS